MHVHIKAHIQVQMKVPRNEPKEGLCACTYGVTYEGTQIKLAEAHKRVPVNVPMSGTTDVHIWRRRKVLLIVQLMDRRMTRCLYTCWYIGSKRHPE